MPTACHWFCEENSEAAVPTVDPYFWQMSAYFGCQSDPPAMLPMWGARFVHSRKNSPGSGSTTRTAAGLDGDSTSRYVGDLGVVDRRGEAIWLPSLRAGLWKPIGAGGAKVCPKKRITNVCRLGCCRVVFNFKFVFSLPPPSLPPRSHLGS